MRRLARRLVECIALAVVFPIALAEWAARSLLQRDVLFNAHAELLSMVPGRFGSFLRTAYYHLTADQCPLSVTIGFGSMFTHSEVELSERVVIASRCLIGMARIGPNTMIGDHTHLLSGSRQHGTEWGTNYQEQQGTYVQINIGANSWIGANCVVFSDIGDNAIVGAGSVVTKPVAANLKVAGNPARLIESAQRMSSTS